MSEVRPQLLITLVHGTWPHFPTIAQFKQWVRGLMRRKRLGPPPLWFEEGSLFLDRLSTELGNIQHKITPLLWSGANSVRERDKTAHRLAEHLSAEHCEHPEAAQLVIAHSHGGNIALRALHHLQKLDVRQLEGASAPAPFFVTLATPFIEIHQADFGRRPTLIRLAVAAATGFISLALLEALVVLTLVSFGRWIPDAYGDVIFFISFAVIVPTAVFVSWWWIARRVTHRQTQINSLESATRLGQLVPGQRLLVIRAIDDEASLVLALGAIVNFITARFIVLVLYLAVILGPITLYGRVWLGRYAYPATFGGFIILTLLMLGVLTIARVVHGWELAKSPMECQINTQSAPDGINLSQIVTLVSREYTGSLQHKSYEHKDCAKQVSDWVRSQLYTVLAR
jgi:hypothetical protein